MWGLFCFITYVVVADVIESYQLGRSSQIGALFRGEDLRHAHDDKTRERVSHLDKIKKAAFSQLKLQKGSDCCICMEPFAVGESTVALECHTQHVFHYECLKQWLVNGHRECPLCRVHIRTD